MARVLAASGHMSPAVANFIGWAVVVLIVAAVLTGLLRLLGILK